MKFGEIRKSLMIFCLSASIALHIGAIWFLYVHPFSFVESEPLAKMKPAPTPQIIPKDPEELLVEKMEKALEESLNTVVAMNPTQDNSSIAEESESEQDEVFEKTTVRLASKPKRMQGGLREEELILSSLSEGEFASSMPPPFDPELGASLAEFALEEELNEDLFPYQSEKMASVDFSDHRLVDNPPSTAQVIEDDYTMTDSQFSPTAMPTHQAEGLASQFVASLKKLKSTEKVKQCEAKEEKLFSELTESTTPRLVLPNAVDYLRSQWIKRSLAERHLPALDHYGLEAIASNVEWEDDVDVDISMMPTADGSKYIFSLTIHPEFETEVQSMGQNFYFLIDRSSSVEKQKFNRFKRAVQRAMTALRDGDRFNIYVFDKNIAKLSDHALSVTPKSIQMAEDFLDKQTGKTHFAAGDVFTTLDKMLPERFNPDEMHSVILITDGNTLMNGQKQKSILGNWAKKYDGNVNFYTAAAGKGNNLVLLDMLSYITGGKLLYSDTNAGFPRKLVSLVRDLHHPIVKNVSIEVSSLDPNGNVSLFPRGQLLPPMYSGKSYTVLGTVDELCDLTLFIQGKNHDRWLNIRKKLTLHDAPRGGRSLDKQWASAQSKICYDHFLKNGKITHLKEAKQIVAPYKGIIAQEQ